MTNFIVDSSAWIEYFSGSAKGKRIKEYITKQNTLIYITGLIVAEVCTKFLKDAISPNDAVIAMEHLTGLIQFDYHLGMEAAEIFISQRKTKSKFGIADAHILAAARLTGAKVLTCDFDFHGIRDAIVID